MKSSTKQALRKLAGYISSRRNRLNGNWTAIYFADEAGLDSGEKYAVVCEEHKTVFGQPSLKKARYYSRYPEFCESCCME